MVYDINGVYSVQLLTSISLYFSTVKWKLALKFKLHLIQFTKKRFGKLNIALNDLFLRNFSKYRNWSGLNSPLHFNRIYRCADPENVLQLSRIHSFKILWSMQKRICESSTVKLRQLRRTIWNNDLL